MEAVALGEGGVLEGSRPGTVYIDLTSNSVSLVRRVCDVFKAHGVDMLDAPVSGGVAGARSGRLAIMVGGDEAAYQRVKPFWTTSATTSSIAAALAPARCAS